ncbi:hypothetical protein PUR34_11585 [Streptomyces sp. JV185]|nr:hypothetical protein [Streptomyces sp. JV185]MEE1768785.1 hypothetical protein [Streptomyces sp. JV185]
MGQGLVHGAVRQPGALGQAAHGQPSPGLPVQVVEQVEELLVGARR